MDKIEDFIKRNKEALDQPRDSQAGWKELEARMDAANRSSNTLNYWKVAAVVFLMSTISLLVLNLQNGASQSEGIADGQSQQSIENYYFQQINLKKDEYRGLANESEMEDLFRDLDRMDEAYADLKASFSEFESEEMADAMLENLRLRIMILNEQIHLIRNGKSEEEAFHSS